MFTKYHKIQNSYNINIISKFDRYLSYKSYATEKVHGANFTIVLTYVDEQVHIQYAKRSGLLKPGEKFFN